MQGIERKMQQLTKVIYHLNARGDDAGELGDTSASYENEIEGILRDAGDRVKRFQQAASHDMDSKAIAEKVREVELKYEAQKQRALKEMDEFKRRAKDAQGLVRREADERIGVMAKELDACKKEFAQKLKQFAEVTEQLEKRAGDKVGGEKKKSANELADVVRKHNAKCASLRSAPPPHHITHALPAAVCCSPHCSPPSSLYACVRYNEMLQQRMAEEEAARVALVKDHEKQMRDAKGAMTPQLEAALAANAALQRQLDEVRIEAESAKKGAVEAARAADTCKARAEAAEADASKHKGEAEKQRAASLAATQGEERAKKELESAKDELARLRSKAESTLTGKHDAEQQMRDLAEALKQAQAQAETYREDAERGMHMSQLARKLQVNHYPQTLTPPAIHTAMHTFCVTRGACIPTEHVFGDILLLPYPPHNISRGATCDSPSPPYRPCATWQDEMETLEAKRREALETLKASEQQVRDLPTSPSFRRSAHISLPFGLR